MWEHVRPTGRRLGKVERLGRYLVDKLRGRHLYEYQSPIKAVEIYTDTDYAGCSKTRKSTSGGVVMFGEHLLNHCV